MQVSLIVAMDENGLIGAEGGMPWHLPNDLQHFKRTTLNKPVLMGRRTHESIGRPLPKRENIILSRDPGYEAPGCRTVTCFGAVRESLSGQADEIMVIGGAQVYAIALPEADRLVITRIHETFEGDTWFPEYDAQAWEEVSSEYHAADEKNPYAHSFMDYRRRE